MADVLVFSLLTIGALVMIVPLVWMISSSLKTKLEFLDLEPIKWIPTAPQWGNYLRIWQMDVPLFQGFINSALISFIVVVGGTVTSAIAAFSFAKLRFPHKEKIFMALLGTMMVPFAIIMIPQFIIYTKIGWIDTWLPLIVPGLFGNVAMIFFLRQYMNGLPTSLVEAAVIDGASYPSIFWKLILPLAKPAVAAQAILWFMAVWNDYFAPSVYINTPEKMPIQVVIQSFNAYYAIQTDYPLIMAASVISMIPVLVVFAVFQRQIIASVAMTGLK
jgi:multiple sugar transport system permease protein